MFASKLKDTLNTHSSSFHLHSSTQLTESDVCDVEFSEVLEAINRASLMLREFVQNM